MATYVKEQNLVNNRTVPPARLRAELTHRYCCSHTLRVPLTPEACLRRTAPIRFLPEITSEWSLARDAPPSCTLHTPTHHERYTYTGSRQHTLTHDSHTTNQERRTSPGKKAHTLTHMRDHEEGTKTRAGNAPKMYDGPACTK